MTVSFQQRTVLPAPPDACYRLSLSVDFHQESFADSGETIVAGVSHGVMALGDHVTWSARHLGRVWTMTSTISAADPPHRFVDEQLEGPFRSFRHEHTFRPLGDGSTEMCDDITFTAPFGPIGRIAELVILRWYMARLIGVRNAALLQRLIDSPHQ